MPHLKGPVPQAQAKEGPMPQLVKKRRSGWAVLAAGALVASILAVGASPAAAVKHRPDLTPEWSACVGAAGSHDAMFSDVGEDDYHADAINCIGYYGITIGVGDGSYAPDENVSAFQMRLFVQRAADLMDADGDAVLSNVSLSDTVTRLEMASLMFGLVDDIRDDVRINRDGDFQVDSNGDNVWEDVDDYFADVEAQAPIRDSHLVGATYELGLTMGLSERVSTDDSEFAPWDPVTRAEMASFITRALDHSNLRPAGLAAQRNNRKDAQISYRDAEFAPIAGDRVDIFSSLYPEAAFDEDDGECESRFTKDEARSFELCEIDNGDNLTDDDGNVNLMLDSDTDPITAECVGGGQYEFATAAGSSDARTHWAWTGNLGDEVDEDTTLVVVEDVNRPVGGNPPDHAHITGGLPTGAELAKMGETVTFHVQIHTAGHEPVGPDRSRNPYHLVITSYFVGVSDDMPHTAQALTAIDSRLGISESLPYDWDFLAIRPDATGMRPVLELPQAFRTSFDDVVFPNSDGYFAITLTNQDVNAETNDEDVLVRFTLRPFIPGNDHIDPNLLTNIIAGATGSFTDTAHHATGNNGSGGMASGYAIFSDDRAEPVTVSADAGKYRVVRSSSTANSVTVTVKDQYGDGYRNAGISTMSTLDKVLIDEDMARYPEEVDITLQANEDGNNDGTAGDDFVGSFNTRRDGTYRIGYNYTEDVPAVEAITPTVLAVADNPATANIDESLAEIPGGAAKVYFARIGTEIESPPGDNREAGFIDVLVADVASRALVVDDERGSRMDREGDDATPMVYYYDEEDTFVVGNTGATLEMWEEALENAGPYQVKWESYEFDRPRDSAVWELTILCGNTKPDADG